MKQGIDALVFRDTVETRKHNTVIAGVDDSSRSLLFRNTLTTIDHGGQPHQKHKSLINQNSSNIMQKPNRTNNSRGGFNIDVRINQKPGLV